MACPYSKTTPWSKVPFRRKRTDNIFFFQGTYFLVPNNITVSQGDKLKPNPQCTQNSDLRSTEIDVFIPSWSCRCSIVTQMVSNSLRVLLALEDAELSRGRKVRMSFPVILSQVVSSSGNLT